MLEAPAFWTVFRSTDMNCIDDITITSAAVMQSSPASSSMSRTARYSQRMTTCCVQNWPNPSRLTRIYSSFTTIEEYCASRALVGGFHSPCGHRIPFVIAKLCSQLYNRKIQCAQLVRANAQRTQWGIRRSALRSAHPDSRTVYTLALWSPTDGP